MRAIFFIFCTIVSAAMQGQNELTNGLQTSIIESWVNGAWQNSTRGTYTANEDGYLVNTLFEQWNTETAAWETSRQVSYTSEAGTQIAINQVWEGGTWVNSNKSTWYYSDGNGLAESMISQLWVDGTWQNLQQIHNTYNDTGHLIHTLYEMWNVESAVWETYLQQHYTLNNDGQAETIMQQLYNAALDAWVDYQRTTNTYTDGLLTYSLYEISPPGWINSSDVTRTYDAQARIYQTFINIWDPVANSWNTGSRMTYYYDTLGNTGFTENHFSAYPNPAGHTLFLSGAGLAQTVSVSAMDGKCFSLPAANNRIDVSTLPAGIYILSVETGRGRQNIKFIRQ